MPTANPAGCTRTTRQSSCRGWQPRQPHPGTRIIHYRCCLPALAGFANYRRERTNGTAIDGRRRLVPASILNWRRGRDSNPRSGYKPLTHFPGVLLQPLGHLSARKTHCTLRGEPGCSSVLRPANRGAVASRSRYLPACSRSFDRPGICSAGISVSQGARGYRRRAPGTRTKPLGLAGAT